MFRNLLAEMARSGLTGKDVSRMVDMDYGSWRNKVSGKTEFTCGEMFHVRNAAFPGMTLDYLFGDVAPGYNGVQSASELTSGAAVR